MGKNRRINSPGKIAYEWVKSLKKSDIPGLAQGALISVVIAFLFYKSIYGLITALIIIPFWLHAVRIENQEKMQSQMKVEFKEYMLIVSNSLQAGYSLERALKQAETDLAKLYSKKCIIGKYIHEMNQKISMNQQVEKVFLEFSNQIQIEEAEILAEILSFSKRAGGDYGKHIKGAAVKIEEKLAVQQEIDILTAEKRLELKIMCGMPIGILAYILVTSSNFLDPLYQTIVGHIFMSICLIVYGVIVLLGKKIISIKA